jgi:peptidyl-prolyl cis-trans isomerase SurA
MSITRENRQLASKMRQAISRGILRNAHMTFAPQHDRSRQDQARRTRISRVGLAALAGVILLAPAAALAQKTAKASPEKRRSSTSQSIVALVNDEPITGYEVEQRVKLSFLGTPELQKRLQKKLKSANINEQFKAFAIKRLKANPPTTEAEQQSRIKQLQAQFVKSIRRQVEAEFRPVARKRALNELIEERLKLQEAKRLNVVAGTADIDRVISTMAERNKMTPKEFAQYVAKLGANISAMRERIKASLSWADVIRRRYGHQIAVLGRDLGDVPSALPGEDDVELHVQRILLPLSASADQKQAAQRLSEAERLRAQFTDCKNTRGLAASISGARFDDLGERKPTSIPEPTRSLLMNASDNQMVPPALGEGGVELWAMCGRKTVKAEQQRRRTAKADLRQKEFEILSKKHLKDLRQDAHIEYR